MIDDDSTRTIAALYRPLTSGRWVLRLGGTVLMRGYWSPPQLVEMIALVRDGKTWMSLTAFEVESQQLGVEAAHGHVVIMGLGMGWAAAATALKPQVQAVTVVERDPDVIAMHAELDLFARLPEAAGEKVRIVAGDALTWRAGGPVDLLMADIWLPLQSAGRVDEVRRMLANTGAASVYFWGQEMEIARRAAMCDAAGVTAAVAAMGLPLVGPERADYPRLVAAAAAAWLRDAGDGAALSKGGTGS